ncbi:MAG: hypothetical protein ABIO36_04030 [Pyrinomonadaceae bacterium]
MDEIKIGRIAYLVVAVLVDIGCLSVIFDPGKTKEEGFGSFLLGVLTLVLSAALSAPVFPHVVWKWIKRERPVFWTVALIVAAFPMLFLLGAVIFGK